MMLTSRHCSGSPLFTTFLLPVTGHLLISLFHHLLLTMYTNESLLTMRLRKTQGMPCLHRMMNYRMTDITLGTAFKSVLILFIISHFYLSNFCTTFQNLWQMLQSNLISKYPGTLPVFHGSGYTRL